MILYCTGQAMTRAYSLPSTAVVKPKSKPKQKEDRRSMDKKMTIRLYEIHLIENRLALKSNEEQLMQLTLKLEALF